MAIVSSDDFQRIISNFRRNFLTKKDSIFPQEDYDLENKSFSEEQVLQVIIMFCVLKTRTDVELTFRLGDTKTTPVFLALLAKHNLAIKLQFNYLFSSDGLHQFAEIAPKTTIIGQVRQDNKSVLKIAHNQNLFFVTSSHSESSEIDCLSPQTVQLENIEKINELFQNLIELCKQQKQIQSRIFFNEATNTLKIANISDRSAYVRLHTSEIDSQRKEYETIKARFQEAAHTNQLDYFFCLISDFFALKLSSLAVDIKDYSDLSVENPLYLSEYSALINLTNQEKERCCDILECIEQELSSSFALARKIFNPSGLVMREARTFTGVSLSARIYWEHALSYFYFILYAYVDHNIPLPSFDVQHEAFGLNQLRHLEQNPVINHTSAPLGRFSTLETLFGPLYRGLLEYSNTIISYFNVRPTLISEYGQDFLKNENLAELVRHLILGLGSKGDELLAVYFADIAVELVSTCSQQDLIQSLNDGLAVSVQTDSASLSVQR